ncbi:hypothetical protein TTRE_0000023501 [Trichuris trichiura]|uniref:Uncharacterized protein n=1 Tax=Trichuris trichiura TaxID=36087 RepID=A0A077YW00_TRITR|nr:hypothetical protein TTRE_0000023501 [Trichuris trichiura]
MVPYTTWSIFCILWTLNFPPSTKRHLAIPVVSIT